MKEINFTEANYDKIAAAIKLAEGRAKERTVNVEGIANAIDTIEQKLEIPKKSMIGVTVIIDLNAQNFAKGYRYTPQSTKVKLIRKKTCWCILNIWRGYTESPTRRYAFTFTEEAKEAIIASKLYMG